MFFEFVTKREEKVAINIFLILFITPLKKGTMIVDEDGNDYQTNESYEELKQRLNTFASLHIEKMCKTYKNQ